MKSIRPFAFLLPVLLGACSPSKYLTIPVDYDPKLSFKPDTTTILLTNQVDFTKTKIASHRKLESIKAGAFTSIRYAEKQLSKLPHVHVINSVDSVAMNLNTDSIKVLAAKNQADYILSLTGFNTEISLDGVQSSTAYYNSNTSVNFVLYEANGVYSKKLNGETNEPQSSGPYIGLIGTLIVQPTVGGNKESVKITAEHATQNALQDYLPYTITHSRPLYNDDVFAASVQQILLGKFDKAYEMLKPLLDNPDTKTASRAAYNLAVVYEAQGDLDIAIDMAKRSLDKQKNDYAANLTADLTAILAAGN